MTYPLFTPGTYPLGYRCTVPSGEVYEKLTKTSKVTASPKAGATWKLVKEVVTPLVSLSQLAPDVLLVLASKPSFAELAALTSGLLQPTTPFTPEALRGNLPVWLQASDASTVALDAQGKVTAWTSKGDTATKFVPPATPPHYAEGKISCDATPLASSTPVAFPAEGWCCMLVVDGLSSGDSNLFYGTVGNYLLFSIGVSTLAYCYLAPNQSAVEAKQLTANPTRAFFASFINGRLRVSEAGQLGGYADGFTNTAAPVELSIGGFRLSTGIVSQPLRGSIREVLVTTQADLPTLRQLEGYVRVTYGIGLPDTHPYATDAPSLAPAATIYKDATGEVLDVRKGVLYNRGDYQYAYSKSFLTTEWVDGSPLSKNVVDPRTQDAVGSKLYTVAYFDEGFCYFEPQWKRGKIDLRVFGITPQCENCSPIWQAVSSYFPVGCDQDFYQKANRPHLYQEGVVTTDRGHWIWGDSQNRKAIILVPPGVVGITATAVNGIKGMGGRYLKVQATGTDPKDNPVPAGTPPLLGFMAPDYAYKLNWHGLYADCVVDFKYIEVEGFSGMATKVQAYINKNTPGSYDNRNASNSQLHNFEVRGCWGGLLINGSDANAIDTSYWGVRDCPGIALIDDSLEGCRHSRWTTHTTRMGHYMARGPGNSATFDHMYGEVQWFAPGDPAQPYHGSYLLGGATLLGGMVSPDGSGRPGSPVFVLSAGAQALVGNYSSGAKFGGTVSVGNAGIYLDGGLTLSPMASASGRRWGIGTNFSGNMVQFTTADGLLPDGTPAGMDTLSLLNATTNSLRTQRVATYLDVKELRNQDGSPYRFVEGEEIQCRYAASYAPEGVTCVQGGSYLDSYETNMTGHVVGYQGGYAFQLDANSPVPAIGTCLTIGGLRPFQVADRDEVARVIRFSAFAPRIPDFEPKAVAYCPPLFRPTGSGSGTLAQRPDLTGFLGPWPYYAKDTDDKGNVVENEYVWTGTRYRQVAFAD